jgi:hypothetical protein
MLYYPFRILNIKFCERVHENERRRKWKISGRWGKRENKRRRQKRKLSSKSQRPKQIRREERGRRRRRWVSKRIKMRKIT